MLPWGQPFPPRNLDRGQDLRALQGMMGRLDLEFVKWERTESENGHQCSILKELHLG